MTRLAISSRNSISLGVANDSMRLGRWFARPDVGPDVLEIELRHSIADHRCVAADSSDAGIRPGQRAACRNGGELGNGLVQPSWASRCWSVNPLE